MRERMESVYLEHYRIRPHDVEDYVRFLNQKVVETYVDDLYAAARAHAMYIDNGLRPKPPIPTPTTDSVTRGTIDVPPFF
jgi:hypothetical protein